jgi:hypothetical protein
MSTDQLVNKGAFALYRSENAHRIEEFMKSANSNELIASDFEKFKSRYVRKFQDFFSSLAHEGLTIQKSA